jgi:hypothetical protein
MSRLIRTHVLLPEDVVEELDRIAGKRGRSKLLAEAARDHIKHLRRIAAAEAVVGSLADVDIPGWETPEASSAWVRALREQADERLREQEQRWRST